MVDRFCYGIPMDEVHDNININERPKWCPLKNLPKKKIATSNSKLETSFEYVCGFNDCIRVIKGEKE